MARPTHGSIQESPNGKNADWMEKVGDEPYRISPGSMSASGPRGSAHAPPFPTEPSPQAPTP
jgi:hypothetical protein